MVSVANDRGAPSTKRYRRRRRGQRYALLACFVAPIAMIRTTCAFVMSSRNCNRVWRLASTRLHSDNPLDNLMEDLLSGAKQPQTADPILLETTDGGWRTIDWNNVNASSSEPIIPPSPVDVVMIRDRFVYLKRDDQLRLPGSQISGNKARKMHSLNKLPDQDFPVCLVSYGGPQSNAMLALAAIVRFQNEKLGLGPDHAKRKRFVYYTRKLPRFLRNQPNGNLFRALSLGMELVEVSAQEYTGLFGGDWGGKSQAPKSLQAPVVGDSVWVCTAKPTTLLTISVFTNGKNGVCMRVANDLYISIFACRQVPQGGACGMAKAGTELLAKEIVSFWAKRGGDDKPLSVCVPGGTCSTAVLLHRAIQKLLKASPNDKLDIVVVVVPCIGDDAYARRQMMALNTQTGGQTDDIPVVMAPSPNYSYYTQQSTKKIAGYYKTFGEPDAAILETFREIRDEHVVLDLLYGAPSWTIMLRHWRTKAEKGHSFDPTAPLAGRDIMYVHSGGLEGISSQLLRYRHKGLIDLDEIQLPGRNSDIA